jgi:hypothetical protein
MGLHGPEYNPQLLGYILHVFLPVIHGRISLAVGC